MQLQTYTDLCSSHRSIFSCESMPPPSDSATHWPISGQITLIPSSYKNYFSSPFWKSATSRESPASREEKPLPRPFLLDTPALTIFAEDNCCYLRHCCDLRQPKELFSLWHKFTFCHQNKPFVVVLPGGFVVLFSAT